MNTNENNQYYNIQRELKNKEAEIKEEQRALKFLEESLVKYLDDKPLHDIDVDWHYKKYKDVIEELKGKHSKIQVMNRYQIDTNTLNDIYIAMRVRKHEKLISKTRMDIAHIKREIEKKELEIKRLKTNRDVTAPLTIPGTERKFDI